MPPMATTTATATDSAARRFASACGVLSQYVKASGVQEPSYPADGAQQLTIFYGGRVVVLDGCTPARAVELIRYAAASQGAPVVQPPAPAFVDMPIARKASLQRFLSKRKDRSAGAGPAPAPAPEVPPYAHHEEEAPPALPKKKGKTEASSWLALGSLGDMHAP
ncbi:hypothetical protein CFC21_062995 [Triticum aestivum]|uniref:Protein TIFY n=2 Tax=Triticum aestivum TaxID=4565 RepID=A0A3B6JMT9_WHEAT|nr:protein TIFY 11a-like [Triticum aestivum]KAF7055472.1 hypothetical protein CFC21_062995 [Triticum aestivum]